MTLILGIRFNSWICVLLFVNIIPNVEACSFDHVYVLLLHHFPGSCFSLPIFNAVHFDLFSFSPDISANASKVLISSLNDCSEPSSVKLASSANNVCFISSRPRTRPFIFSLLSIFLDNISVQKIKYMPIKDSLVLHPFSR